MKSIVMRQVAVSAAVAVFVLTSARTADAQQAWQSRGFVTVNGTYQATSTKFSDNIVFVEFVEQGDLDAGYDVSAGPLFDVGGAVRVWKDFGVGVNASAFSRDDDASVTARIPHPFFFNRGRQISGAQGVKRKETAVHVQGIWLIPVNRSFEVALSGGPTFFSVKQDLVTKVLFSHTYPYDTAKFAGTTVSNRTESKVGFNVGADVAFYPSRYAGFGLLIRFSRASINLPSEDGGTVTIDTGGFQAGGGLRLRF